MRIAMFTNTYLPHVGGVARSVSALSDDLRALGHEVTVVAPTFPGNGEVLEIVDNVVRVPAVQNFNGSDFSVRLPVPVVLNKVLDELQLELVHSHHPFLLGDTAVRVARRYDVPLLFTHHTRYEKYTHYVSSESSRMQEFAANLATEYANLCDSAIAPSDSIAELIRARGVTVPVEVVATGVDTAAFAQHDRQAIPREFDFPAQAPVIGHVGRLAPEKNLDFLAASVTRVLRQRPDSRFIVAGEGPAQQPMEEAFDRAGVADRVFFLGNCSGQRLIDVFAAMDCFVFASRTETQGMVLTEAMAAGAPVVALDAPGAREVVDDSNGQLVDNAADSSAFAAAVIAVLGRDDLEAGIKATAARYSRDRIAREMAAIYQRCINEHETVTEEPERFDALLARIKSEWELASQKASAAVQTWSES
ncbi:MAG: glycosyltransferase [Woeseiaceae bacterium]|nr:glycosyltransferase [Woeseiaceae bacterium]